MENRVTCDTCKANRVCDHNRFGFETCRNYIPSYVVPRSVIMEIFAELDSFMKTLGIRYSDMLIYSEIKNKYSEGSATDADKPMGQR